MSENDNANRWSASSLTLQQRAEIEQNHRRNYSFRHWDFEEERAYRRWLKSHEISGDFDDSIGTGWQKILGRETDSDMFTLFLEPLATIG